MEMNSGNRYSEKHEFDATMAQHQNCIQRFAMRMLPHDPDAGQDVAIESFVRLWKNWEYVSNTSNVRSWLLRCAFRLSIDELRRRRDLVLDECKIPDRTESHSELESLTSIDAIREALRILLNGWPANPAALRDSLAKSLVFLSNQDLRWDEAEQRRIPTYRFLDLSDDIRQAIRAGDLGFLDN